MLSVLLLSAPALAAWPDDVDLTALSERAGAAVLDPAANQVDYETVVLELGAAIANKPMYGAATLGVNDFEFGLNNTIGFTSSQSDSLEDPSPWARVHTDGEPADVLWVPGFSFRKGLPMSLEVGANMGWVAMSRQTAFGGYVRGAPLEGYRQAPDVAFQLGYSGYVGNEQLELGVLDWSGTISYDLHFGAVEGVQNAKFTPFAGVGQLIYHAQPRLSDSQSQSLGIKPVSGFKRTDAYDPGDTQWRQVQVHGGFVIVNRGFHFRVGTAWTPKVMPTVNVGLGFTY
jgi:hypothetical protein